MKSVARPTDGELLPLVKRTSAELFDRYNKLLKVVSAAGK